jgi:hypothetical protein
VIYYLAAVLLVYGAFLLAQHADRRTRRAFAARLGALYRVRGEFWRLCVWAQDARGRGDAEAAARFREQAAALLPRITGESKALRMDEPALAGELGWTAGMLDDELADMGRAVAWTELRDFERWITGRARPPVETVLNPPATMENDTVTRRIYQAFGAGLGAAGGFAAWMVAYWGRHDATLAMLAFFILLGAAVLGHVAGAMRAELWTALARIRHRSWWAGPA